MGLCTLPETTEEISNLADAVLGVAYRRISEELTTRYGRPGDEGFSIISLGKLGGKELNYSSDIDLMFVYGGNGETAGPHPDLEQGVLQEGRQPANRLTFHLHRRRYAVPRGLTAASGRTAGRSMHLAGGGEELLPEPGARLGTADVDQGPGVGGRAEAGAGTAGIRGSADLFEHAGLFGGGSGIGDAGTNQREAGGAAGRLARIQYQARAGRDSRHRVPGAVPAAVARRAGKVGAARRDDAGAFAAARQGSAVGYGIFAAGLGLPVPAGA